jgi:hypothetical protein
MCAPDENVTKECYCVWRERPARMHCTGILCGKKMAATIAV